eukprot:1571041-Prymnesium_polylepis.2
MIARGRRGRRAWRTPAPPPPQPPPQPHCASSRWCCELVRSPHPRASLATAPAPTPCRRSQTRHCPLTPKALDAT